ncbi:TIGR04283 family arsenosugar biosynthesis glycosyltransferase [Robiginitalea sp. SC105]|uniref:TIGR04283 family arsenosugar biosynthesis glycosyltransferase n=1 Tax=Robiginitalea sp. SC105 TaxID=2762332 RepID=UPI00163B03F4|nr:TIGR04283 family arsenosugar biosynthesis glycosyltransferase [Robiginitalea sp. SC105]MBC2837822.1 TIGR04283 family arsenosugar biosynthesis glycosyltransferase [Robiginitalea sp. SC105]
MQISIIIPVLNEEENLRRLLPYLRQEAATDRIAEVLVVDGGSTDASRDTARALGARVLCTGCGRALQMNAGAHSAKGELLYFLHADSIPPRGFDRQILQAQEGGPAAGCFRLRFEGGNRILRFFAWFSRFNCLLCRGGDQSLFVPAAWFRELQGFDTSYRIYEDNEFISRLYGRYPFRILKAPIYTSDRKYRKIGTLKLQYYFGVIHLKRFLGAGPESLYEYYNRKIGGRLQRSS